LIPYLGGRKIQFDVTILTLISIFALTVVTILLMKYLYRPDPHYSEHYGDEIVLFHGEDRYEREVWRFNLIDSLEDLKNRGELTGNLELKVIVGEFNEDTQEIIKYAVNHQFELIVIIGGPRVYCEDRRDIYTILDKYKHIKYLILPKRPTKHFMIFNKNHLFIERPHRHYEIRDTVGIKNAKHELVEIYDDVFTKMLKYAKPVTKEDILKIKCYK